MRCECEADAIFATQMYFTKLKVSGRGSSDRRCFLLEFVGDVICVEGQKPGKSDIEVLAMVGGPTKPIIYEITWVYDSVRWSVLLVARYAFSYGFPFQQKVGRFKIYRF